MVLPFYKVLSLVIRVFSRPLIGYVKKAQIKTNGQNNNTHLRSSFVWLGNASNRWEAWVNRKFMKIDSQFAFKPLNDELAIEKGIQFFYEIFFYSIMIGLPLYQMVRASREADEKSHKLNGKLENIENNLEKVKETMGKIEQQLHKRQKQKNESSGEEKRGVGKIQIHFYTGSARIYDIL